MTTGADVTEYEDFLGHWFYETCFRDRVSILDIGPGRCWFTRQNPKDIVALDMEPEIVELYKGQGIRIELGSVYDIPFDDGTFDGVFCCWLFEHLTEPEKAATQIGRVLRVDGYSRIIVPSAHSLMRGFYDDYARVRPFTTTSLVQMGRLAGFHQVRVQYLSWDRGSRQILHWFGRPALLRCFRFYDTVFRKSGIVNRDMLMLEAWK